MKVTTDLQPRAFSPYNISLTVQNREEHDLIRSLGTQMIADEIMHDPTHLALNRDTAEFIEKLFYDMSQTMPELEDDDTADIYQPVED